jgi:hypothetical protein
MRRGSLILGIVLVVLVLVFYVYNSYSEGFESTADKVQDRTNLLAAQQNPIKNPAANIGIPEAQGAALRSLTEVALNSPIAVADGTGSYKQVMPTNLISPRIDNENSLLGLIKMCKDKGAGDSPFSDSAFNANCGICTTSGTLKTGESFTGPTGVVVYQADKAIAINSITQKRTFPQVVPSLNSAICVGASRDDTSLPVLAIRKEDYDAFRKRKACRDSHKIGGECGLCLADQESTWVSPSGTNQTLRLDLWGAGLVKVSLSNGFTSALLNLSNTTTTLNIGRVKEGTKITIDVLKGTSIDGPYIYGTIVSNTVNDVLYKLPIEKFLERDAVSGVAPRRNGVKYFDDTKVFCSKIMGQGNAITMSLQGFIPITILESSHDGAMAALDCPSGPIIQSQASAELLIDDVCLKPKGQGPGKYSKECIQKTILQGGCSTNGNWYKDSPFSGNFTLSDLLSYAKYYSKVSEYNPSISMGCKGIDISTPCDHVLHEGKSKPSKECMAYLYSNESEKNKRVGRAYKNADTKYASVVGKHFTFCKESGSLNPTGANSANAMGTLTGIALGYKGISGIEAVKTYLSDVFMKAVSNLDVNVDDADGGRRTSWEKCFGIKIADGILANVTKNSINDVIDNRQICSPFPKSIDLIKNRGKFIGQVALTQDYSLSFNITPRGIHHDWSNIIHFTTDNTDSSVVGSRSPAIFFFPGELKLHIRIGDSRNLNWGIDTSAIPVNQTSSFSLECVGNKVTVMVNDKVYTATQPTYRPSGNAIVYATHPLHTPANAYIDKFCYNGGGSPAHISPNYSCVKGWDHGGDDLVCWSSGVTIQELENRCDNSPHCKSFNTWGSSGGCMKNLRSGNIRNENHNVTNFCVKNT